MTDDQSYDSAPPPPPPPTLPGWYGPETLPARDPGDKDYSVTVICVWFDHDFSDLESYTTAHYRYGKNDKKGYWSGVTPDAWCYLPESSPETEPGEHKKLPDGAYKG